MLALAAGLLAGAVACSSSAEPPPPTMSADVTRAPVSAAPSAASTAVTVAEAREIFTTFIATDDTLRAADPGLDAPLNYESQLIRDGQAQLTAAAFTSTGGRPPRYTWGTPTMLVPRLRADERTPWFSVLVARNGRPTLLTFAKGPGWQLSSAAELLPDEEAPQVELDADGYATPLATDDKSILIGPKLMAPLHATVAEAGARGVAADLLSAGPYTTEVAAQIATDRGHWIGRGYIYDSIVSAGEYPFYALRTEDGGALIQYTLTRTTTMETKTKNAEIDGIPVPDTARWAISATKVRRMLKIFETHQYATVVPAATAPSRAHVIAHDGGITRATGD